MAAIWIDLETVIPSEVSQTEKEKYHTISLFCGVYKEMIQMNLFIKQRQTRKLKRMNLWLPGDWVGGRDS